VQPGAPVLDSEVHVGGLRAELRLAARGLQRAHDLIGSDEPQLAADEWGKLWAIVSNALDFGTDAVRKLDAVTGHAHTVSAPREVQS
jgi:hypothetical protein